jgi:ubiquinone biosynthesis protein
LLEPFPPIDVSSVMKDMEGEHVRVLLTFRTKAKYTEWWERTSAPQWLAMVRAARRYGQPMNLNMLRMVRATLLYDTLVLRLDHRISRWKEFARFRRKDRTRWAEERWRKRRRRMRRDIFLQLEDLMEVGGDLIARAQQTNASPTLRFTATIEKWVFAFGMLSRTVGRLIVLTAVGVAIAMAVQYVRSEPITVIESTWTVVNSRVYQAVALALIAINLRAVAFRLRERDIREPDRTRR